MKDRLFYRYSQKSEKTTESANLNYVFSDGEEDDGESDEELDVAFPVSRIKGILKSDPENKLLSKDVILYLEKAAVNNCLFDSR